MEALNHIFYINMGLNCPTEVVSQFSIFSPNTPLQDHCVIDHETAKVKTEHLLNDNNNNIGLIKMWNNAIAIHFWFLEQLLPAAWEQLVKITKKKTKLNLQLNKHDSPPTLPLCNLCVNVS